MGSAADDIMGEIGSPLMLEMHGRGVTIEEPDTDAVTVTAIVGQERVEPAGDDGDTKQTRWRPVTVPRDTTLTGGGIADPKTFSKVTVGSAVYTVTEILTQTPTFSQLRCEAVDTYEVSREQYRGAP